MTAVSGGFDREQAVARAEVWLTGLMDRGGEYLTDEMAEYVLALAALLAAAEETLREAKTRFEMIERAERGKDEIAAAALGNSLGSGETDAQSADGTGSYPKDRLMFTDSPQYPHRCFTTEGEWVSCPPDLCEADFLLREYERSLSSGLPEKTEATDE
jgi:hypothetical protein